MVESTSEEESKGDCEDGYDGVSARWARTVVVGRTWGAVVRPKRTCERSMLCGEKHVFVFFE